MPKPMKFSDILKPCCFHKTQLGISFSLCCYFELQREGTVRERVLLILWKRRFIAVESVHTDYNLDNMCPYEPYNGICMSISNYNV